jgi:hypothetical protein
MTRADKLQKRQAQRDQVLADLQSRSDVSLTDLDEGQRWLVFVALHLLGQLGPMPQLRRVLAWLLCHCGLGLPVQLLAATLDLSTRALSPLRKTQPAELLRWLQRTPGRKKSKLRPEHVGRLARFLVDHPDAQLRQILEFARTELGVSVKRHALRRFLLRYSLGELNKQRVEARPLFVVTPPSAAPLC